MAGAFLPSRRMLLKYIVGVKATPTLGAAQLVDNILGTDMHSANLPASQKFLYQGDLTSSARHQLVQLRIGGAQMLASTKSNIYNHNQGHPLFFSQTSPKAAGLCAPLIAALRDLRIRQLTELQGAMIPLLIKGKHVIAHAETGTGKSFGVALAVANRIVRDHINYRLHTIILCPTDELCLQYDKWLKHFGKKYLEFRY